MIEPDVTDDAFLGGKIRLLQPVKGFRSGLDAMLLAAAVPASGIGTCRVIDAGSGAGAVGLAIAARCTNAIVTLVEIDPALADLARRNVERNGLDDRVSVVVADVAAGGKALHDPARPDGLAPAMFEHVVTNPPYFVTGTGTPPSVRSKAGAHQMSEGGLARWIAFLATAATADGTLTMIHRADALADVLNSLDGRFGRLRILPVQPREDEAANRIIVSAIKGSRAPLEIRPALVIHDGNGRIRPEIEGILRHGAPLEI
jgi:tRNA1(Val) A37 N6-methylase TrmN6